MIRAHVDGILELCVTYFRVRWSIQVVDDHLLLVAVHHIDFIIIHSQHADKAVVWQLPAVALRVSVHIKNYYKPSVAAFGLFEKAVDLLLVALDTGKVSLLGEDGARDLTRAVTDVKTSVAGQEDAAAGKAVHVVARLLGDDGAAVRQADSIHVEYFWQLVFKYDIWNKESKNLSDTIDSNWNLNRYRLLSQC